MTTTKSFADRPLNIGGRLFPSRLIQGPLAGFSCAPFRSLFYQFQPPAYTVSEMISAHDVLNKHTPKSRYLQRASNEQSLCYQLSGTDPLLIANAAHYLEQLGADLIDLNCGCPKPKIRKKGAGSALLETPDLLVRIIEAVCKKINIPLTVKIRIGQDDSDLVLARQIENAGAQALIVHGRQWTDDYNTPSDYAKIARIKSAISIPVIANGDITDKPSLMRAIQNTGCDAYMISRAGSGHPWLYQQLLDETPLIVTEALRWECFMMHLYGLAELESPHSAVLQSKAIARYYFKHQWDSTTFQSFYALESFSQIEVFIK